MAANGANGTVDLRGEFIRGWDGGRGVDSGRALASWKDAETNMPYQILGSFTGFIDGGGLNNAPVSIVMSDDFKDLNASGWGSSRNIDWTKKQTQPRNVALLACMKL